MFDTPMPMAQGTQLPQFSLRQIDLPDIAGWEVNSQHYIIMKVEVIAKRNNKDLQAKEDQQKVEADFEVLSIRPLTDKPVDTKSLEQKEFDDVVTKALSGEYARTYKTTNPQK